MVDAASENPTMTGVQVRGLGALVDPLVGSNAHWLILQDFQDIWYELIIVRIDSNRTSVWYPSEVGAWCRPIFKLLQVSLFHPIEINGCPPRLIKSSSTWLNHGVSDIEFPPSLIRPAIVKRFYKRCGSHSREYDVLVWYYIVHTPGLYVRILGSLEHIWAIEKSNIEPSHLSLFLFSSSSSRIRRHKVTEFPIPK